MHVAVLRAAVIVVGLLAIGCGADPAPAPKKPAPKPALPAALAPADPPAPKESIKSAREPDPKPAKPEDFADAADTVAGKWNGHGLTVRVPKAQLATIEVAGAPKPILLLDITILNGSPRKHETLTWQHGGERPTLTDDQGRTYATVTVPQVPANSQIYRRPMMPLYPNKQHLDLLAAEPPGEKAEYLLLELPGANVGNEGPIRFRIPRSMWTK